MGIVLDAPAMIPHPLYCTSFICLLDVFVIVAGAEASRLSKRMPVNVLTGLAAD